MRCLYTSWHCCIPPLRFTAHVDKMVVVANGPDPLFGLLALLGQALVLTPGCFELLLGLLQAHGRLWGAARPALCGLASRGVQMRVHLLKLLLSLVLRFTNSVLVLGLDLLLKWEAC